MKLNWKLFLLIIGIEAILLIIVNYFYNILLNASISSSGYAYYAPLLFSEKTYLNSRLITNNFYIFNLIINIAIILLIPLIISLIFKNKRKKR